MCPLVANFAAFSDEAKRSWSVRLPFYLFAETSFLLDRRLVGHTGHAPKIVWWARNCR